MKEKFEIEKELKFNSNIAEVTSISLEEKHDFKDGVLKGYFIVSGEYKIHQISLNKEKFNFKIPFELPIKNDVDENTLEVEVSNFIYDADTDSLFVTINYEVSGDRKDILLFDDEENLEEFLKSREVEIIMGDTIDAIDDTLLNVEVDDKEINEVLNNAEAEIVDKKEEIIEMYMDCNDREKKEEVSEEVFDNIKENDDECFEFKDERNVEKAKADLLESVSLSDENYITYKIHIVKSDDTIDAILSKYNMSLEELKEYNEISTLQLGDKLIIPIINEQ